LSVILPGPSKPEAKKFIGGMAVAGWRDTGTLSWHPGEPGLAQDKGLSWGESWRSNRWWMGRTGTSKTPDIGGTDLALAAGHWGSTCSGDSKVFPPLALVIVLTAQNRR
jgi:hypothetical protein